MCENINSCGCTQPCSCPPVPCTEGCLTDTLTDCTFLSEDLDICSEIIPKGSPVTEALSKLGAAVCDGITVTVQDMKVKVDASDTTTGYLFDKLTVGSSLTKTITSPAGNETIRLDARLDTVTAGNILTSGVNGLYVPTPTPSSYLLTPVFSSTIALTIAPVLGGQTIKADAKISPNVGNLLTDNGGLYVSMPALPSAITISKLNTNSINTTLTLLGSNYEISSNLRIDPSSTAPISITAQGLKVDCCVPVIPANTPVSVVLGSTACVAMTATGIDNHVLTPSVVVSPSAGNALTATVNGLYCPAPGAAAATTIIDTPTVDATLVSPGVYSLAVGKSTDSCNALVLGTDNKLYVNGVTEPNSLGFIIDGTDIYFEFQGLSTLDTDYIVEAQGTTGSPLSWIPISFDSLSGPVLRYYVGATTITQTIRARVKYICSGGQESDWVGLTYIQPVSLLSETLTISINPASSGVTNEFTLDIAVPSPGSMIVETWTAVPGGAYLNGCTSSGTYPFMYKISKDLKNLYFRGAVNTNISVANGTTSTVTDFLDLAIFAGTLGASMSLTGTKDSFPYIYNKAGTIDVETQVVRTSLILSLRLNGYNTTGSAVTYSGPIMMSNISIH